MPFLVSGSIGEKSFDRQVVPPKELAELLGVKFKEPLVTFEMTSQFQKFDKRNNTELHSRGFLLNPEIAGMYQGQYVTIRYFTRRRQVQKNNQTIDQFTPDRLRDFGSKTLSLSKDLDYEAALAYFIHHKHEGSPLYDARAGGAYYKVFSVSKQAEEANAQTELYLETFTKLKEANVRVLLMKAKGIVIQGERPRASKSMTHAELVRSLTEMAMKHPTEFALAYNDATTDFNGTIEVAIEAGVVIPQFQGSRQSWYFSDKHGGDKICEVPPNGDPKSALRESISARFGELFSRIERSVAGEVDVLSAGDIASKMRDREKVETPTAAPAETPTVDSLMLDKVLALKEEGRISIHKAKVYLDDELMEGIALSKWKEQMVEYFIEHPEKLQ